jgi:hypothetical protein
VWKGIRSPFSIKDEPRGHRPRLQWPTRFARLILGLCAAAATVSLAFAQEDAPIRDVKIPNPMSAHTLFIILAIGIFLAWCISYSLQIQKESAGAKPRRNELLRQKDRILDRLAELESEKETGSISKDRYEREFRKVRSRLSEVLERLKERASGAGES